MDLRQPSLFVRHVNDEPHHPHGSKPARIRNRTASLWARRVFRPTGRVDRTTVPTESASSLDRGKAALQGTVQGPPYVASRLVRHNSGSLNERAKSGV